MFGLVKNIARHTVIYSLADLAGKGIAFLMIPLYTYYLTTEDYGTLELLDLTSYVIGLFLALGISQSVVRFFYDFESEEKRQQVISVALISIWILSAVVLIGLFPLARPVSNLVFQSPDYARLFNILFATLAIQLSNEMPMTVLRIRQKSMLYAAISLTRLVLTLSLNILFIVKYETVSYTHLTLPTN